MDAFDEYVRGRLPIESELAILFPRQAPLTIFDVGACEGEDSIRYQLRFPRATVHAFEPVPENIRRAREHFEAYGLASIHLEPTAVADTEGEAELHVSAGQPPEFDGRSDHGNRSSSLLPPAAALRREHPWLTFEHKITVPVTTLSAYASRNDITSVDLLHVDVQGAELMVLAGAGRLLDGTRVVWLEAEAVALYDGQPLRDEVEAFMRSRGFAKITDTVGAVSGDQLYIQPRLVGYRRASFLRLRAAARRFAHQREIAA